MAKLKRAASFHGVQLGVFAYKAALRSLAPMHNPSQAPLHCRLSTCFLAMAVVLDHGPTAMGSPRYRCLARRPRQGHPSPGCGH
eukprot:6177835-Amphidinium_carterae.1